LLDDLGHVVVPEAPLGRPDDGPTPFAAIIGGQVDVWWVRFFDYF